MFKWNSLCFNLCHSSSPLGITVKTLTTASYSPPAGIYTEWKDPTKPLLLQA